MANVSQLIRRQSSRELAAQRSIDRLELELEARLVPPAEEIADYGATNHGYEASSPGGEPTDKVGSPRAQPKESDGAAPVGDVGVAAKSMGEEGEERESWDSKLQFLLATIGYAVGLGNVWRFPYLAQKNGGGAFLIPYFLMLMLVGLPVFYLELAVGQRIRKGAVGVWHQISPYIGGLGIASAVVSFIVALYYNMVITWCLYYLFQSFQSPLPWSDCHHAIGIVEEGAANTTLLERECKVAGPTQYFWYRDTLDITSSLTEIGPMNWKLVGCLAISWLLIYVCIMKGIVASGKVVYVTSIFPYAVLLIFFCRSVTLRGMADGVEHLFTPRWEKLSDPVVWLEAGTQIFFSLGLAFGGLIAFGSYNPVNNNCVRDALLVSLTNCFTSLFASIVVFAVIGFKAHEVHDQCLAQRNETIESLHLGPHKESQHLEQVLKASNITLPECDILKELENTAAGTGLAFIVFTEAINQFPLPPLWAVLFFLMLFTLGADSQFGTLEGVITSIVDLKLFPTLRKEILTAIVCFICFLFSTPFSCGAGNYVFQLFDSFAGNIPLLVIAFFECIAVSYFYGIKKFSSDIELMSGSRPSLYWLVCWKFASPFAMLAILSSSLIKLMMEGGKYQVWDSSLGASVDESWPWWALVIAGCLVFLPLIWIPLVALLNGLGVQVLADETPAWFPEKELRSAHDVTPQRFTALERALLCLSVSTESLTSMDGTPVRRPSKRNGDLPTVAGDAKKGGGGGGGGGGKPGGGGEPGPEKKAAGQPAVTETTKLCPSGKGPKAPTTTATTTTTTALKQSGSLKEKTASNGVVMDGGGGGGQQERQRKSVGAMRHKKDKKDIRKSF